MAVLWFASVLNDGLQVWQLVSYTQDLLQLMVILNNNNVAACIMCHILTSLCWIGCVNSSGKTAVKQINHRNCSILMRNRQTRKQNWKILILGKKLKTVQRTLQIQNFKRWAEEKLTSCATYWHSRIRFMRKNKNSNIRICSGWLKWKRLYGTSCTSCQLF